MRKTVLYANRDHALAARKRAAKSGNAAGFGFEALAVQDFFNDAWTVWGDARRIVSARLRSLLLWKLLGEQQVLGHTLGTARLLEGFLEQAAGMFEAVLLAATETTSEALKNAVETLAKTYYATLREKGLIEAGDAAVALSQVMPKTSVSLAEYVDLLPAQRALLESWDVDTTVLNAPVVLEPLDEGVQPSFLIPAGATATTSMIKDEIESYLDGVADEADALRSVLILAKRPGELFRALAPYLTSKGVQCAVKESVAFSDTWVGKACTAVQQLLNEDSHWLSSATDFAYNPLSGMPPHTAEALNATCRGDRRLTVVDVCQGLTQQSTYSLFADMIAGKTLANEPISELAGLREESVPDLRLSEAESALQKSEDAKQDTAVALRDLVTRSIPYQDRDRELSMLDEVRATLEMALALGLQPADTFEVLQDLRVITSQETLVQDKRRGRVVFAPISAASKLSEKSYGLVILGDVSDEAFNLSEEHSSLEAFAAQLGIELILDPLQDARRLFVSAQKAAMRQFTCVFAQHNEALEEAFPSCIYDEYRELLEHSNCVSGQKADLSCWEKSRGEERLNRGLGSQFGSLEHTQVHDQATRGKLQYASMLDYLPTVEESGQAIPVLSASAIEAYLNCPYGWFVNHGLGVSCLDEAYDGRAKGTFVHQVFATFYERLKTEGVLRSEVLLQEGGVFDQVFDQVREDQWIRTHDQLIALTEAEKKDLELLRELLRRNLQLQLELPGDFQPAHFEYRISSGEGIDYAGARLRGSIDRVDVNRQTNDFVVLDYKGNSVGHEAPFSPSEEEASFSLPTYVQSLIYAQAVRRKGLGAGESGDDTSGDSQPRCAGAMYVGYRAKSKKSLLEGSYDQASYKVMDFVNKDSQVKGDFSQFLDLVEEHIAPSVQALASGEIPGNLRSQRACQYCALAGRGSCLAQMGVEGESVDGLAQGAQSAFRSLAWEAE